MISKTVSVIKFLIGLGAFMLLCQPASGLAQEMDIIPCMIDASVEQSIVTIGDRIHYTVSVEHDSRAVVEYPDLGRHLKQFEIKNYEVTEPTPTEGGWVRFEQAYVLTLFEVGEHEIPSVSIICQDLLGEKHELSASAIPIRVKSVNPEQTFEDIRPLKSPADLVGKWPMWVWVLLLGFFLGVAGLSAYLWWRKQRVEEQPVVAPLPPERVALEALAALRALRLLESGLFKEYYDRLSDIIRAYLEGRYGIVALDRTTEELYREMRAAKIERGIIEELREFLQACDQVKFATYRPESSETDAVSIQAKAFIEKTTPEPVEDTTEVKKI